MFDYAVMIGLIVLPVWLYFFFSQKDIPLLITSVLLLFLSADIFVNTSTVLSSLMMYGIGSLYFRITIPFLILGILGITRSIQGLMVTIFKSDSVVDSWYRVVEGGAGKGDYVLGTIERMIIDAQMPGVATRKENVSVELFGEKRPFLIVQNLKYKEYKMCINARDFGKNLDVSWYFMAEPRYLQRTLSKHATGNPLDMTMRVSLFAQQDISAFKTITHEYVKRTLEMLYDELKLDPSGLNTGSRGFLNVW